MKPEPLFDLQGIDLDQVAFGVDAIRERNPHRHEFELLDAVVHYDPEALVAVARHDLREDAFWVRGHIPGHPIFPGALMVEAGAQLCSFIYRTHFPEKDRFFAFGGIDKVKFRSSAAPGDRFYLCVKTLALKRRASRFAVQGMVEGRIVFEGEVTGVSMPVSPESGDA